MQDPSAMNANSSTRRDVSTATLLMTDVENSTRLWEENKKAMGLASARHDEIVEQAIHKGGGRTSRSQWEGDSVVGLFSTAFNAAACALQLQLQMSKEVWPEGLEMKLRIAIYTGEAVVLQGMVSGSVIPRAIALRNLARGGQILVSQSTAGLLSDALPSGSSLIQLGSQRLRPETQPESIYQLSALGIRSDFPALDQISERSHGMPHQLTSFVGRKAEIRQLKDLLGHARIITVTGTGGLGKTRLAMELAQQVAGRFRDGVFVVELGGVSDPLRVPEFIAAVVGAKEKPPQKLISVVMGELASKDALLILDDCEHLVGSVAHVVDSILKGARGVKLIVTSRQSLAVDGETLWRIPPLNIPPANTSSPETLERYESTELFLKRARERDPSFSPTPVNTQAIADICRRVDGIPLAVELAASRVQVLSPEQIATRLGDLFRVLTGGARTALPRQRTLEATIDWSYQLLGSAERRLFRDLSVFKGGFTIEAAESVCDLSDEESDVLNVLIALVEKSLVLSDDVEGRARFRLLEALRQFGFERLVESGSHDVIAQRHIEYFAAMAERARDEISGPQQTYWSSTLAEEDENVAACLEWSSTQSRLTGAALSIVANLAWFWHLRGTWGTGYSMIKRALDAAPIDPTPARAQALIGAAIIGHSLGDPAAVDQGIAGQAMALKIGDRTLESQALKVLGDVASSRADYQEARRLHETALRIRRDIGETGAIAESLYSLADVLRLQGEYEDSRRMSLEALDEMKKMRDEHGIARVLSGLGHLEERQSNYEKARSLYQQALEIRRKVGDVHGVAAGWQSLANVAWAHGDQESAKEMFSMAADQMERLGDRNGMAVAISGLGHIAAATNDYAKALELYGRSIEIRRELGDRHGVGGSLHSMGNLALAQGDPDKARELFDEALTIARTLGSRQGIAATLNSLGNTAGVQQDYDAALRYYTESLEIKQELGERHGIAISLANMGLVCMEQVQVDEAHRYFSEAHSICSELGMNSGIATSLHGLARVDRARGFLDDAIQKLCQSLKITEGLKDKDALADVVDSLGGVLVASGSPETAARAFGLAEAMRTDIDTTRSPMHVRVVREDLLALERVLSRGKAEMLMKQGASMSLGDLLAEVQVLSG